MYQIIVVRTVLRTDIVMSNILSWDFNQDTDCHIVVKRFDLLSFESFHFDFIHTVIKNTF